MRLFRLAAGMFILTSAAFPCRPAQAFFHLWRFTEVFSAADGDVQFIELHSSGSGETVAGGATITSMSTGKVFTFPENLMGDTFDKRLLIATDGFSSLTGAVTPDYTLPSTDFFNPAGDTLRLVQGGPIDTRAFTSVPTDGVMSRNFPSNTLATNSPTNFVGDVGSVNVQPPGPAADFNGDNVVDAQDLSDWKEDYGLNGDSDADGDLDSDGADFLIWQIELGETAAAPLNAAVPEPAGAILANVGLLGAAVVARTRHRGAASGRMRAVS
jgi:hypothetical protein